MAEGAEADAASEAAACAGAWEAAAADAFEAPDALASVASLPALQAHNKAVNVEHKRSKGLEDIFITP